MTPEKSEWFTKLNYQYACHNLQGGKDSLAIIPDNEDDKINLQGLFTSSLRGHRSNAGWAQLILPHIQVWPNHLSVAYFMNVPLPLFQSMVEKIDLDMLKEFQDNKAGDIKSGMDKKDAYLDCVSANIARRELMKNTQLTRSTPRSSRL